MTTAPNDLPRWPEVPHYQEAERLIAHVRSALANISVDTPVPQPLRDEVVRLYADAQVHATLALVDELRAGRESAREIGLAGLSPGARRDLLP